MSTSVSRIFEVSLLLSISIIGTFFDITNWNYDESFYYTELCAYIHSQLATQISSVVIVGSDAESKFGDLFEIVSDSNELFYSTATVDNVEIVNLSLIHI